MELYNFCMYLGFTGFFAMALLSLGSLSHGARGSHHSHGHNAHGGRGTHHVHGARAGHEAHGVGGQTTVGHGHGGRHAQQAHGAHHGHGHSSGQGRSSFLGSVGRRSGGFFFNLLSPRVFFSLMLGFGATGMLVPGSVVPEPYRMVLAMGGGFGFEHLLVGPMWNFLFRFASDPARTLESAVCEEAQAVTNFDASGNGLISIDLDGQVVQVLGTLNLQQRGTGTRVRSGDRLFVEAVDAKRNSCTVSLIHT